MKSKVTQTKPGKNYSALKNFCFENGADLFGVADISSIKDDFQLAKPLAQALDKAVCLGVQLSAQVFEDIEQAPTKLYFHHYRTANMFLDQLAFRVAQWIQRQGSLALPIPASQIVDWKNQTAHLSHKKLGVAAGLGWIGRNNLLVSHEFGSRFRLVTVLTDALLRVDTPLKADCGDCVACISACPVGAIQEKPQDFKHEICFAKLKEFQKSNIVGQYICGVCVHACKPLRKERPL